MTQRYTAEEAMVLASELSSPSNEEDMSSVDGGGDDGAFVPNSDTDTSDSAKDEEIEEVPECGWKSRSGAITWSPTNADTLRYQPAPTTVHPGPTKYAMSRIDTIRSSFELLMPDAIIRLVVENTNLQGKRKATEWKPVDATEIRAFIGLLILAGVFRSRGEDTRSLWDQETGRHIFRATMSRKRFHDISRMIHFDDKLTRSERQARRPDKLAAFRSLWDMWEKRLSQLFNPGENICVDEQLVPYRGHCPFRQYIPNKPAKYGIKIWVACDVPTSYAWRMQVYTGRGSGAPREVNQGQRVVLELTKGLQGKTVTCDNFFTSYRLADELLKRKNALVGTIRRNKPELPPQLLQLQQRVVLSSLFAFTQTHTAVSYVPHRGRNVLLLSTKHREAAVSTEAHKKPEIILDYNRCKGGVDNLDKVIGTYSCRRRTCRWPQVLFFNVIDVSAFNAYVLWTAMDPSWLKGKTFRRRKFLEELGKSLVSPLLKQELPNPAVPNPAVPGPAVQVNAVPDSPAKRRLCHLCTGKRKKIATTCNKCMRPTCKVHSKALCNTCFE